MRQWDDTEKRWVEYEVAWSGTLARQDDETHSLLTGSAWQPNGNGWFFRESLLPVQKPEAGVYMKIDLKGKANSDVPFAFRNGKIEDTGTGCKCQLCGGWVHGVQGNRCAKCRVHKRVVRPLNLKHKCKCGQLVRQKGTRCETCKKNCVMCRKPLPANILARGLTRCSVGIGGCRRKNEEAA